MTRRRDDHREARRARRHPAAASCARWRRDRRSLGGEVTLDATTSSMASTTTPLASGDTRFPTVLSTGATVQFFRPVRDGDDLNARDRVTTGNNDDMVMRVRDLERCGARRRGRTRSDASPEPGEDDRLQRGGEQPAGWGDLQLLLGLRRRRDRRARNTSHRFAHGHYQRHRHRGRHRRLRRIRHARHPGRQAGAGADAVAFGRKARCRRGRPAGRRRGGARRRPRPGRAAAAGTRQRKRKAKKGSKTAATATPTPAPTAAAPAGGAGTGLGGSGSSASTPATLGGGASGAPTQELGDRAR